MPVLLNGWRRGERFISVSFYFYYLIIMNVLYCYFDGVFGKHRAHFALWSFSICISTFLLWFCCDVWHVTGRVDDNSFLTNVRCEIQIQYHLCMSEASLIWSQDRGLFCFTEHSDTFVLQIYSEIHQRSQWRPPSCFSYK